MEGDPEKALILENRHTGERLALRKLQDHEGLWLELNGSLPPRREGPPLHVHFREDEGGRVVARPLVDLDRYLRESRVTGDVGGRSRNTSPEREAKYLFLLRCRLNGRCSG